MQELTFKQIADVTGGKCADFGKVSSVSTDTRTIEKGALYIALKGENFDGHDFIAKAFENGAAAVLSERETYLGPCILVASTDKALLDLAGYYRTLFPATLVGITGSVGKTTTKEMTACVLESKYKTLKTIGNLNNQIGTPMTLLRLEKEHEAAVIEMGMSNAGEISALSKAARPDLAVITNIGYSHIEFFGTRENILKAKLEILDGTELDAPLILNGDDDLLSQYKDNSRTIVLYGIDNPLVQVRAKDICSQNGKTSFVINYLGKSIEAEVPAEGKHIVYDALAAFCVGILCKIPAEDCVKALKEYVPVGLRQHTVEKNGVKIMVDCYNASPTSVEASLTVLSDMKAEGRKIAVIGDMLELGGRSAELHARIADFAAGLKLDCLLCLGEESKYIASRSEEIGKIPAIHFTDKEDLADYLKSNIKSGDLVSVKGSRGMKLEEVIKSVWGE